MVAVGDDAPDFTVPIVRPENAARIGEYTSDDVESFTLSDALATGPVILAFFPGAFTRTCTVEMCSFRDWRTDLEEIDAQVYGVSVDTPWSLLAFINEYDLNYPMLSGFNNSVIEDYGMALDGGLLDGIADRGVFVINTDGTVIYRWVGEDLRELPDLDAISDAVATA